MEFETMEYDTVHISFGEIVKKFKLDNEKAIDDINLDMDKEEIVIIMSKEIN